jgi:hypothetical protein
MTDNLTDLADSAALPTFEQAFAELAAALKVHAADNDDARAETTEETNEIERLDAVTLALDMLPQLDPHRVTDLLQKSAALAALAGAAAASLQAATESHEVKIDINLAVTARADLRFALDCLDALSQLAADKESR